MARSSRFAVVAAAICLCSVAGSTPAQTPAPAPAPQTFWNWMGIPSQPFAGIRNRGGNFPAFERKPALKKIADPANLASENAAIKKAAEIKAQEDMAAQKIKAIKYLAEIGCGGCYKGVDKALAEALADCTEAVRYEAVLAIISASACGENQCVKKCVRQAKTCKEAACDCWVGCMKRTCATMHLLCGKPGPDGVTLKSKRPGYACGAGGNCPGSRCACGDGNCCTSEILNKLSTMAFEKDDRGCWKEPSPRVRAMARQALRACGPNIRPLTAADIPVPEEVPLQAETVPAAPATPRKVEGGQDRKVEGAEEVKPVPQASPSDSSTSLPVSESQQVAEEPATVVAEQAEVVMEQVEVVTEQAEVVREQAEVVREQAEVVREQAEVVTEPAEVVTEPAEVVTEAELVTDQRQLEAADDSAGHVDSAGQALLVSVDIPMAPSPDDLLPSTSRERAPAIEKAKGKGRDQPKAADSRILPFFRRW